MYLRSKDVLALAVLTFITILVWIGFEAYHAAVTSTVPERLEILVQSLSPKINVEVIDKLKSR